MRQSFCWSFLILPETSEWRLSSGEREERRTESKTAGRFGLHRRARTCVYQHARIRGYPWIPSGIYLDAFFTRRARGLSVKRLLLWLSVRCTAIQMSVRCWARSIGRDLRTWSVRGQFLSYPLWSRSRAAMPTISARRTAIRIDTVDYCGNRRRKSRINGIRSKNRRAEIRFNKLRMSRFLATPEVRDTPSAAYFIAFL